MSYFSLERISYQPMSELGLRIQEIIEKDRANPPNISEGTYVQKDLQAVVKEFFDIDVEILVDFSENYFNAYCQPINNSRDQSFLDRLISRNKNWDFSDSDNVFEYKLDKSNSKIINSGKDIFRFKIVIFKGVYFGKPSFPDIDLTVEEATAVILHELGHMWNMVEHTASVAVTALDMERFLLDYNKEHTEKDLKEKQEELNEKLENSSIPRETIKLDTRTKSDKFVDFVINYFKMGILKSASFLMLVWYINFGYLVMAFNFILMIGYFQMGNDSRSDKMNTKNTNMLEERQADEFASRHGYGVHMVSAFAKLEQWAYGRNSSDRMFFNIYLNVFSFFNYYHGPVPSVDEFSEYGDIDDRLKSMLEETRGFFKNQNLPKEYAQKLSSDIDYMERQYKEIHSHMEKARAKPFFKLYRHIGRIFRSGNKSPTREQYAEVELIARDMSRNKFFEIASKSNKHYS